MTHKPIKLSFKTGRGFDIVVYCVLLLILILCCVLLFMLSLTTKDSFTFICVYTHVYCYLSCFYFLYC